MIAVTSISPNHINFVYQKIAVQSWINAGMEVVSVNKESEIEVLKEHFENVTFKLPIETMEAEYGKPYVSLDSVFSVMEEMEEEKYLLINSDIEIIIDPKHFQTINRMIDSSIVVMNRNNYNKNKEDAVRYKHGIDLFFINKKYLSIYPESRFALGQCHFDYWIPLRALRKGIEVNIVSNKIAFHKDHKAQYSHENWIKTGQHLIDIEKLGFGRNNAPGATQMIYQYIYSNMKEIEL